MSLLVAQFIFLGILVVMSAVFSATEVAYTGLDRHMLKRLNRLHPGVLSLWEESPHRVLATLLLSNNGVNTAVGVIAASMATDLARTNGWDPSLLTLLISFGAGAFLLFFGEMIPKIGAQRFAVTWAVGVTPFMKLWSRWVSPVAKAATALTHVLLLGQARQRGGTPFLKKSELRRILLHSRLPSESRKLLDNVIDFARMKASDVMTARPEIFSVSLHLPMEKVIQNVIKSGWSRVPVHSSTLDQVVGVLYSKDLLVAWRSGTLVVLHDLLRPTLTVSPEMPLPDLLRLFRTRLQHLAVVRNNENGPVLGVVTIQDALEAIVGHIKEEN